VAFIGPWEIALILAIVLILFGPKKLPELAKGLGDAIRQYRQASEGGVMPTSTPVQVYPQTQVAPTTQTRAGEILIDTAKQLGIQTDGKTLDQISKEITDKTTSKSN
jgi:sec-independent protein translocase protein TatA